MDEISNLELRYRSTKAKLNEYKELVDIDLLRAQEIIGLTTTCAARLHTTIKALQAPIGIVILI